MMPGGNALICVWVCVCVGDGEEKGRSYRPELVCIPYGNELELKGV